MLVRDSPPGHVALMQHLWLVCIS